MSLLYGFFVATLLFIEVVLLTLFCIPCITPSTWKMICQNQLVIAIQNNFRVYSTIVLGFLAILLMDSIREILKYGSSNESMDEMPLGWAQNDALVHSRLFRAQRNFYITGATIFMFFVIKRMAELNLQIADIEEGQPQQN